MGINPAIFLATLCLTGNAQANCAALNTVLKALPGTDTTSSAFSLGTPEICGKARSTNGAAQAYCAWSFPLKSTAAQQTYELLRATLPACDYAQADQDLRTEVNHPDTYAQRLFENDRRLVSLSLKDKGGLNASYVFLRVEPK